MSLAYHILAFKNVDQVARLCRALRHPDDLIVLHIDRRAPPELHTLARHLAGRHANLILQRPRAVLWGGPRISELQIEAMALALQRCPAWSHFINLSGQDFPLCPREVRLARLADRPDATYLSHFDPVAPGRWRDATERIRRWHLHSPLLHLCLRLPGLGRRVRALLGWTNRIPCVPCLRRAPPPFRYVGGANHGVFARAACRYLTTSPAALRIRRWLRPSASNDEIVFQSALLAGPLAGTVVNRDWREIDFLPGSPHPRIYGFADFGRLTASENLFARKFDDTVDPRILPLLERHLALVAHDAASPRSDLRSR